MNRRHSSILAFIFIASLLRSALSSQSCSFKYTPINGYLCINSQFIHTFAEVNSEQQCANRCRAKPECQAFSLSDGPCQLFVFNKCSKSVRDCGCSRRGRVFVKQQPGLDPGLLCPPGYGDDLCGVKYKVYEIADKSWKTSRQKCESESGLVIMADVTSAEEMGHVDSIRVGHSMWLGGFQEPGSDEPGGGWYWVGCNITVDSSLWAGGEPSNHNGQQYLIASYSGRLKLSDMSAGSGTHCLCECQSPFN